MEPQRRRLGGEQERAARSARNGGGASAPAQGADHLPAERPVAAADLAGLEARRPSARARAGDRGGHHARRTGAGGGDPLVEEGGRAPRAARGYTCLSRHGAVGRPLDQQAERAVLPAQCAGREGLGELHVPDQVEAILDQGAAGHDERLPRGRRSGGTGWVGGRDRGGHQHRADRDWTPEGRYPPPERNDQRAAPYTPDRCTLAAEASVSGFQSQASGATLACRARSAATSGEGTTSTGRSACCRTAWETLPSRIDLIPVRPREPSTIALASTDSAADRMAPAIVVRL